MDLWCVSIDHELKSSHPLLVLLLRDLLLPVVKPEPVVLVLPVLAPDSQEVPRREILDTARKRRNGDSDSSWVVGDRGYRSSAEDVGSTEGRGGKKKAKSVEVEKKEKNTEKRSRMIVRTHSSSFEMFFRKNLR